MFNGVRQFYSHIIPGSGRARALVGHPHNMRCFNPFAFSPMAVTLIITTVYILLLVPLLFIHTTVPAAPTNPTVYRGLNLTEAWLDLTQLTDGYHPFNSRRNDDVRNWNHRPSKPTKTWIPITIKTSLQFCLPGRMICEYETSRHLPSYSMTLCLITRALPSQALE